MSSRTLAYILSMAMGIFGFYLIALATSWPVAWGFFLALWANNVQLALRASDQYLMKDEFVKFLKFIEDQARAYVQAAKTATAAADAARAKIEESMNNEIT